jgi:hypothetical protein
VATFGEGKKEWLAKFLDMSEGTPSHDTFSLVFARLNPEQLQDTYLGFGLSTSQAKWWLWTKKLRHSFDSAEEQPMITMVSASTEAEVVLDRD